MFLVRLGHVSDLGGEMPFAIDPPVASDTSSMVQDLDCTDGKPHFNFFVDVGMWDAVVVPVNLDVIIQIDPRFLPLGELVALGGEWSQCRPIQFLEE